MQLLPTLLRRKTIGLYFFPAFLLAVDVCVGQWAADRSVNTAVCTSVNEQSYPNMIADDRGGTIVVWQDFRSGTNYDIYAQRFDALGMEQWTHNGVTICSAAGDQLQPQLVADGTGGAILAWEDHRNGTTSDIYAQRISASGTVQWQINGAAVSTAANDQAGPQLVGDDFQGAIIAWHDNRNGAGFDIYAQHLNASGSALWTADGVPVCTAPADQENIAAIADGTGGAILTWGDHRADKTFPDIYAQRVDRFGALQWQTNGVPVDTSTWCQGYQKLVSDGSGGAIVTWFDTRRGMDYDVYAQRVNASGTVAWTANGMPVCTYGDWQEMPQITGDGAGGAIIAWEDFRNNILVNMHHQYDIYAQHINTAGEPEWTVDGIPICYNDAQQGNCQISDDGHSGAVIVWEDWRGGEADIYGQHVSASGRVEWTVDGMAITSARGHQRYPRIVSDARGGSVVAWQDYRSLITTNLVFRNGPGYDIYMQNIDASGHAGYAPALVEVRDIANDQGGKVSILWRHSFLDTLSDPLIKEYEIFRGIAASKANQDTVNAKTARDGYITNGAVTASGETIYWEALTSTAATYLEAYSCTVPTPADSGAQGTSQFYYMVRASNSPTVYWDSQVDSGYSVDNLAPVAIGTPKAVRGADRTVTLSWPEDTHDPDLSCYIVYRAASSGFMPGAATEVARCIDTTFTDKNLPDAANVYYRVAARDIHGNLGTASPEIAVPLSPANVAATEDAPHEFALDQNYPNPFNPSTIIRYALPSAAYVKLEVYNTLGARVAILAEGDEGAGIRTVEFNASALASGVYYYRLEAGEFHETKKFVLMR